MNIHEGPERVVLVYERRREKTLILMHTNKYNERRCLVNSCVIRSIEIAT